MGAGRGRARRAASTTKIKFSLDLWNHFVNEQGITNVTIERYYELMKISEHEAAEKAAQYLFADLVALGALQLPTGYTIDDFDIKIVDALPQHNSNYTVECAVIAKKGTNDQEHIITYPIYHINKEKRLGSNSICDYAACLNNALTALIG